MIVPIEAHGFFQKSFQGHNTLIQNVLKTVTDMRLDPREDFFESSHGLSIGTVRFDLG